MHNYIWCPIYIPSFMKIGSVVSEELWWQDFGTDGQTDGVTRLLYLLSPLATQVIITHPPYFSFKKLCRIHLLTWSLFTWIFSDSRGASAALCGNNSAFNAIDGCISKNLRNYLLKCCKLSSVLQSQQTPSSFELSFFSCHLCVTKMISWFIRQFWCDHLRCMCLIFHK